MRPMRGQCLIGLNVENTSSAIGARRKATQFKQGKAAIRGPAERQPAGRGDAAGNHASKDAVTENGKTRRIPALEVMLRRLANDAMRSDPRAP